MISPENGETESKAPCASGSCSSEKIKYFSFLIAVINSSFAARLAGEGDQPCGLAPALGAHSYAIIGDGEGMFGCLDEVMAAGRPVGLYLKVHPAWEPYRNQPRFQELLRRLGLEG